MISADHRTSRTRERGAAGTERRLAAILGADIKGYSALMGEAEERTHSRVGVTMDRVRREIEKSYGRVFSFAGDGLMAEFPSAVEALKCALRIQAETAKREASQAPDARIAFRIGLNAGEIVVERGRTGGNSVNVAARLEEIAEPGGICLSAAAHEQVRRVVVAAYQPAGERKLKNIRDPVGIVRIAPEACRAWAGMPALPRESQPARPDAVTEYRTSLAVLPFRTLQGDQADAYFAEGMVDDIIRALGGLKHLLVIARSSSHLFAGSPLDLRRIAHELDVRYVVHGSVRRAGGALRIAVELAEAPGGQVIWTDRFDGKLDDLFDFQDRIAIRVATAVAPHLRERELARATRKHPENMTAYDLTLQALDQMHRIERKALDRANALLQQAIASDPQYAFAYAQLAFLNLTRAAQGWAPRDEAIRAAVDSARAAMKYDPNDAHSLTMFGHVQSYAFRDYQSGNEFLESAIASNPSWPWAWGQSSVTCGYLGDYERSVARAEHAVRLSPIGSDAPWFEHCLSQAYYLANRFEEAAGWGRLSAIRNTSNSSNLRCLIASLVAQGEMDEAKHFAAQLIDLSPDYTVSTFRARTPLSGAVADRFAERLRRAGLPA